MRHILIAIALLFTFSTSSLAEDSRPNILWIVVEDMSADFNCYQPEGWKSPYFRYNQETKKGESICPTPHVDQLAADGVMFKNAVTTAPVCSACRSALITGMYQTSIGAHHHRSGRGEVKIHLPEGIELVPQLFKESGYHVSNLTFEDFTRSNDDVEKNQKVKIAKTDYNFEWAPSVYEKTHWTTRDESQPFFAQIQCHGGKLRGNGNGEKWLEKAKEILGSNVDPKSFRIQPYLFDHPIIRQDWAQYLDTVRYTDWEVGEIVERLKEAGDYDNTVIFFMTDHGISHVRHKQFMYDGGIHIPLIICGPGVPKGEVRSDVVEQIDLAATSLAFAGIKKPSWMQSQDILAKDYQPRQYVFSARDRCDETIDHMRSVRSKDFKYIRNFLPDRPWLQPNAYKDAKPIQQAMRQLYRQRLLNEDQSKFMAKTRPKEELYDLVRDPYELNNLAGFAEYQTTLSEMRHALDQWMEETNDLGRTPESWEQYDSDMAAYVKGRDPESPTVKNIELMKKWAAEGK